MLSSAARGKLGFMCQKMVEILIFHLEYVKNKRTQQVILTTTAGDV